MADHTYRYLSALVSQGSFSQAARYLDISQPSLSQFIQRLEAEAGTELIDRTSRPLRLTAAGDCFLQTERRIEQLRDLRTKEIADIGAGIRGHVRLGVSQYRSSYFLPLVLPRFRSLFPAIDITLVEATNDALETCAADGTTDVSIVLAPVLNNELTYSQLAGHHGAGPGESPVHRHGSAARPHSPAGFGRALDCGHHLGAAAAGSHPA